MKWHLCLFIVTAVLLTGCQTQQSVLSISDGHGGWGSGFVIQERPNDWVVATAAHVIESGVFVEGREGYCVQIHEDAAIVFLPKKAGDNFKVWTPAPVPMDGEPIRIHGVLYEVDSAVNRIGYITLRGYFIAPQWHQGDECFYALQCAVHPGMSGGPVEDAEGRAVGVVSRFSFVRGQLDTSIMLCVPIYEIQSLLEKI